MSGIRDINTVASIITIANAVKESGCSPSYIASVVDIPDEEALYSLLKDLGMVFSQVERSWYDREDVKTYWYWTETDN